MPGALPQGEGEPLVGSDHLARARLMTESTRRVDEGQSSRLSELLVNDGELVIGDSVVMDGAAIQAGHCHRDERRSGPVHTRCARMWRWVLLASQAMAACDLTGQLSGWGPAQNPVVPDGWIEGAPWADEPRAVMTEVAPHEVRERPDGFTPAELARLRVLRARYQASHLPFTTRELAHLLFVRWLRQTGRLTP